MTERWIKASEIGEYLYCQRAWWYRLQGATSANVQELASGSQAHAQHGWGLRLSGWLRLFAFALLAIALLVLALQLLQ
jgi:CRISPR/Cas system-associated exonuclease Cas4 (RecB family)